MKQEVLEQFRKDFNKYYSILNFDNSELSKLLKKQENDPRQKEIDKLKEKIEKINKKIKKLEKELENDPEYELIEDATWTLMRYRLFSDYDSCGYSSEEEFAYKQSEPEINEDETYGYLLCVVPYKNQDNQIYEYYNLEKWTIKYKIPVEEVASFEEGKKIIHLPCYTTYRDLDNFKKHFCMKLLEQNPEEAFNSLLEEYDMYEEQKRLSKTK